MQMTPRYHTLCPILTLWLGGIVSVGCGPRVKTAAPDQDTAPTAAPAAQQAGPTAPRGGAVRSVLVGEMCPTAAGGRAAVAPLYFRGLGWETGAEEVADPVRRRAVRQFSVIGFRGTRVGVFAVAGAADIGIDRAVGFGAYVGSEVCATEAAEGKPATVDATCTQTVKGCGLAIGLIEGAGDTIGAAPYEEDPQPLELSFAATCLVDGRLSVDIDGDGVAEFFRASDFVDPVRAPAGEVTAVNGSPESCTAAFMIPGIVVGEDPRHLVQVDLLGTLDIDGDGRREVALAFVYSERRTIALYTATSSATRLELIAETSPWQAP